MKTAAFSGPRPEKLPFAPGDVAAFERLGNAIEEQLYLLINRGYTRFFSGMSRGVDLIAAERVLGLRVGGADVFLAAAVPFRGQQDDWEPEDRAEYKRIIELSDVQVVLSEAFTPRCYSRRNCYMVEQADLLLAVYDGRSGGGTEQTIGYAAKKGIPITLINPDTLDVTQLIKD